LRALSVAILGLTKSKPEKGTNKQTLDRQTNTHKTSRSRRSIGHSRSRQSQWQKTVATD
jgi:hypothetical protein